MKNKLNSKYLINFLYILAALFLPNLFLFYLFNNNQIANNLYFSHFLIFGIIIAFISLILFLIFYMISKNIDGALFCLIIFWIIFWLFGLITRYTLRVFLPVGGLDMMFFVYFLLIIGFLILFRKIRYSIEKLHNAFRIIPVTICILFIVNFTPAFYSEVIDLFFNPPPDEKPYYLKTEFVIDKSLPSPDVYWFHVDGMIGFDAAAKHFGDNQEDIKFELQKRGFVINESAELNIGYSDIAIPALISPAFYDSYLEPLLTEFNHLWQLPRKDEIERVLRRDRINIHDDIMPNQELFNAFLTKDYSYVSFWHGDANTATYYYTTAPDLVTRTGVERSREFYLQVEDFKALLLSTTPLLHPFFASRIEEYVYNEQTASEIYFNMISHHEDVVKRKLIIDNPDLSIYGQEYNFYRCIYDSLRLPSPKLYFIELNWAHEPFDKLYWLHESFDNLYEKGQAENIFDADTYYMELHRYTIQVFLNAVDLILEHTPDAVIVIQADHGIECRAQLYMLDNNYPEEKVWDLFVSTISAVRIPEEFGRLDEPLEPLDITKFLINSFVGKNYSFN